MKIRTTTIVVLAAAPLVLAGCGNSSSSGSSPTSTASSTSSSPSPSSAASTPTTTSKPSSSSSAGSMAGMSMAPGQTMGATPPKKALMVCGGDVPTNIRDSLKLKATPKGTTKWSDNLFTCTYPLADGNLVLTVKQSTNDSTARAYFNSRKAAAAKASTLSGLASLGLPAYETAGGTASFVRDNLTLEVDATAMKSVVGVEKTTRKDFAYTVASFVLACWREH